VPVAALRPAPDRSIPVLAEPKRPAMALTSGGICVASSFVIFVICIIIGFVLQSLSGNRGEVGIFYQVDTCKNLDRSFQTATGVWDAYTLRAVSATDPLALACSSVPAIPQRIDITLEADDGEGYRGKANYVPVIYLPQSSYVTMAFDVVNYDGDVIFPVHTISLGPNEAYPWTFDGTITPLGNGAAEANSGEAASPASPPAAPTRRLLFATDRAQSFFELHDDDDYHDDYQPAAQRPGSRRLLKGGSSGGSSGSASSGGRSGTTGSSRWGSSSGSVSRTSYTAAAASSTRYSSGGHYYGGRSYYAVGGYGYYGGYRPYSYFYGPSVILYTYPFYVVGYRSYGCYSCCRYRGSCGECDSRKSCGQEDSTTSPFNLDRYEIDVSFKTPSEGSDQWPLTLRIYNATQFLKQGVSIGGTGVSTTDQRLYFSFFTSDGDAMSTAQSWLLPIGWIGAIITLILMVCFKRSFFQTAAPVIRQQSMSSGMQVANSRAMPYVHNPPTAYHHGVQQVIAGQPMQMSAMPVAVPVYAGQPSYPQHASMPVAAPYPGQASMPVAYPTTYANPYPTATAYPSNPPSPPTDLTADLTATDESFDGRGKRE